MANRSQPRASASLECFRFSEGMHWRFRFSEGMHWRFRSNVAGFLPGFTRRHCVNMYICYIPQTLHNTGLVYIFKYTYLLFSHRQYSIGCDAYSLFIHKVSYICDLPYKLYKIGCVYIYTPVQSIHQYAYDIHHFSNSRYTKQKIYSIFQII